MSLALTAADGPGASLVVSVVVMAYNEVGSLADTVHEIAEMLATLCLPHEIVIVDDGSDDGTAELADRLQTALSVVRVVHHRSNLGLGGVYRTGFETSRAELVTFFPADGQFPASTLQGLLAASERHDMVLGYIPARNDSMVGRALSWCERRLYDALFGRLPRFQGVLMFRRMLLGRFRPRCTGRGWGVLMEFIIRVQRSGASTVSIPTSYRPRRIGHSKVNNWQTIRANLAELWAVRSHLARS